MRAEIVPPHGVVGGIDLAARVAVGAGTGNDGLTERPFPDRKILGADCAVVVVISGDRDGGRLAGLDRHAGHGLIGPAEDLDRTQPTLAGFHANLDPAGADRRRTDPIDETGVTRAASSPLARVGLSGTKTSGGDVDQRSGHGGRNGRNGLAGCEFVDRYVAERADGAVADQGGIVDAIPYRSVAVAIVG